MTSEEWKRRCIHRIYRAVKKAGRIRLRDLKRATHYNRGGEDSIGLWFDALDHLGRNKHVVVERDADGIERFVRFPEGASVVTKG
jgi:hypothetical protein